MSDTEVIPTPSREITHRHFIIHKPFGYLSQFKLVTNRKVQLLGNLHDFPPGTMAIGRLDKDSEGLLLLTTDGKVSYKVTSGRTIEKEYYVQLDGDVSEEALEELRIGGIELRNENVLYKTLPCKACRLNEPPQFPPRVKKIRDDRHGPTTWVSISIREGKYRQVRKMTAKVGFPTLRLFRVRIGGVHLGTMKAGEVKEVTQFDL